MGRTDLAADQVTAWSGCYRKRTGRGRQRPGRQRPGRQRPGRQRPGRQRPGRQREVMPNIDDKWGSTQTWLRALYLRTNVIWIFREELVRLELGQLRWLEAILRDVFLAITVQAGRFATNEEAF